MTVPMSLARWKQPWAELGLEARMELHADLRNAYSEPERAYHTLHHISECLQLLQQTQGLAQSSASIELAIWFHDAIYDPRRSDNEERSALWAQAELRRAGASPALQDRITSLVMVTRHDGEPQTRDEELMSDIDLAILGADSTSTSARCGRNTHTCRRSSSARVDARSSTSSWRASTSTSPSGSARGARRRREPTCSAR